MRGHRRDGADVSVERGVHSGKARHAHESILWVGIEIGAGREWVIVDHDRLQDGWSLGDAVLTVRSAGLALTCWSARSGGNDQQGATAHRHELA